MCSEEFLAVLEHRPLDLRVRVFQTIDEVLIESMDGWRTHRTHTHTHTHTHVTSSKCVGQVMAVMRPSIHPSRHT